jgi:Na+-transporting NADH:ubiquinone oxidoreductase subunit F
VEIGISVAFFTGIVLVLGLLVLLARKLFVPSGECDVSINDRMTVTAAVGRRLLEVLAQAEVRLPSACGGAGTCGLCKLRVIEGGGEPGPQELAQMTRAQASRGTRLACQVPVLAPMRIEVDDAYFGVRSWTCSVQSTRNVSTLIREIVLALPEGEEMEFRAGGFVQVTCKPFHVSFADFAIEDAFRDVWDKGNLWSLEAASGQAQSRAYSMANHPGEKHKVILNVRIALPPPYAKNIAPGAVSSWLYSLRVGDLVEVTGPFGHFFVEDTDKEAVFIGGGAGMAPLRAQILDLLELRKSKRTISFWYGGRSRREIFYSEDFERLDAEHDNFSWHVALSDVQEQDDWKGHQGFIHKIAYDHFLARHPAPQDCEYYLCGPPLMVKAVLAMLDDLGVEAESIHYDDFGGASSAKERS